MIPDPRSRYVILPLSRSDTTVRRDDGGLVNARQNAIIGGGRHGSQGRFIETLDDEPDAKRQLPNELREGREDLPHRAYLDDPEYRGDPRRHDQRTADESQHGQAPGHESGGVHQVAQTQPVPYADYEAGSEQERPVMERHQRIADRHQRAAIRASSPGQVLPQ